MYRTASTCRNQDSSQSVCFIASSRLAVRPASSWRIPSIPVKAAKSFSSNFLDGVLARSSVLTWGVPGFDLLPLICSLSVCPSHIRTAGFDLLPLTCFLSGCLRHRASTWGMAGFCGIAGGGFAGFIKNFLVSAVAIEQPCQTQRATRAATP